MLHCGLLCTLTLNWELRIFGIPDYEKPQAKGYQNEFWYRVPNESYTEVQPTPSARTWEYPLQEQMKIYELLC